MAAATPGGLRPGDVIAFGRYRVEDLLGHGGFGDVYRAAQLALGRHVALKVLRAELLHQDDGLARFQREAQLAQRLEHPNTVRLYDFGQMENGVPFIAFELLRGEPLDRAIRTRGPMPSGRVARIASQVLKSLMEAHAAGIVHRDIKPANIFLCEFQGESDFVKVLDFGIAKATASQTAAGLTKAGLVIGTPHYMAPEQLLGNASTPACDLYALGLTMAEALTGHVIVTARSQSEVIVEQLRPEPLPMPPAVLQSPLGPILLRATQKDATRRYQSAAEMLADVDALMRAHGGNLDGGTVPMKQATPIASLPTAVAPSPGYAGAAPYLPSNPAPHPSTTSSGSSAAIIVGIVVALLFVVAGAAGAYFLLARDRGSSSSSHESDDDKPSKTKDKNESSSKPKNVGDDDDNGGGSTLDAKTLRKRIEAAGWDLSGDSTSHSPGLEVVTFTVRKPGTSEVGGVYLYLYDDPKMASSVEGALASNKTMAIRRSGGTIVMAYVSTGKSESKSLLDDVFPP